MERSLSRFLIADAGLPIVEWLGSRGTNTALTSTVGDEQAAMGSASFRRPMCRPEVLHNLGLRRAAGVHPFSERLPQAGHPEPDDSRLGFQRHSPGPDCCSQAYQITVTMVPDGVLAAGECGLCGARAQCLQPSVRDRRGA
jgi:hypothetical protein